jgi:putative ABC transport system substrate-binding protein
MGRREFIMIFAGVAAMWTLDARAQQSAGPVIGFLSSGSPKAHAGRVAGFRKGLNESAYMPEGTYGRCGNSMIVASAGRSIVPHP